MAEKTKNYEMYVPQLTDNIKQVSVAGLAENFEKIDEIVPQFEIITEAQIDKLF